MDQDLKFLSLEEKIMMLEQIRPALVSFVLLTVMTGVFYPAAVTGAAGLFFKRQAEGSLMSRAEKVVGSALIGQPFDDPRYFWGRPSAAAPAFNGAASSGSNYGPLHADFLAAVEVRVQALKAADPQNAAPVPVDLVTASGSGLDPHISLAGARYQAPRIARLRGIPVGNVQEIIRRNTQGRLLGIIGEPVVNVLKANLALDETAADGAGVLLKDASSKRNLV